MGDRHLSAVPDLPEITPDVLAVLSSDQHEYQGPRTFTNSASTELTVEKLRAAAGQTHYSDPLPVPVPVAVGHGEVRGPHGLILGRGLVEILLENGLRDTSMFTGPVGVFRLDASAD